MSSHGHYFANSECSGRLCWEICVKGVHKYTAKEKLVTIKCACVGAGNVAFLVELKIPAQRKLLREQSITIVGIEDNSQYCN